MRKKKQQNFLSSIGDARLGGASGGRRGLGFGFAQLVGGLGEGAANGGCFLEIGPGRLTSTDQAVAAGEQFLEFGVHVGRRLAAHHAARLG